MKSINDIATIIGIPENQLKIRAEYSYKYYKTTYLPKRNGDFQTLNIPTAQLKGIQRWILHEMLYKIDVSDFANGFIPGRGIKRNAMFHAKSHFFLCIDIKNFFSSIKQKTVEEKIQAHFSQDICQFISKICCYKGFLPQGAPTSPYLSNIVFCEIDNHIDNFCQMDSIYYSRYADDLTFSCDNYKNLINVKEKVESILSENNYVLNEQKTRFLSSKNRISITGLNLNKGKPQVGKNLKRKLRTLLHHYYIKKDKSNEFLINGYLSYIKSIEPEYYSKNLRNYIDKLKKESVKLLLAKQNYKSFNKDF